MTIAECTEKGVDQPEFDIDLYSGFDEHPVLSFMLPDECWPDSNYNGGGVFTLKLEDLLKDAIDDAIAFDQGEGAHKITALLREYADKIDKRASEFSITGQ